MEPNWADVTQLVISFLGFTGAILTLYFGFRQYKRAEQWKRGEFIAKEIKEFETDPFVRNALTMIDWGKRKINLFLVANPGKNDLVLVTREDQWRALLPHPLKPEYPAIDRQNTEHSVENDEIKFTMAEAKIRDTYDSFLGYFERFANFIKSGLVNKEEFKPYIKYWIDSIAGGDQPDEDDAWQCALITFINFYNYTGVKYLFNIYGKNIEPHGNVFKAIKARMKNQILYEKLIDTVQIKRKPHKPQVS